MYIDVVNMHTEREKHGERRRQVELIILPKGAYRGGPARFSPFFLSFFFVPTETELLLRHQTIRS